MKKEGIFDIEAAEANIELNEKMNDNSQIPHGKSGEASSTTEANFQIQEAFNSESNQDESLPTYIYNNTPAIKITGNDK